MLLLAADIVDAEFRCFVDVVPSLSPVSPDFVVTDWARQLESLLQRGGWLEVGRSVSVVLVLLQRWTVTSEAAASVNFASRQLSSATSSTFDKSLPDVVTAGIVFVWLGVCTAELDAESLLVPFFTAAAGDALSPAVDFDAASLAWNINRQKPHPD